MSGNISISDESYSEDDEEEELDPRIQDGLEKLNAATNSINHLEAELDEARAVFRQTLAGATYQLNGISHKLGKCVEKSRPFYEAYRQLRQSHNMLQKSTNMFERATGMHIAAKTKVAEAERRVFGGNTKRTFDPALQEKLNEATIEVNEAEKMKRDSWKKHQDDLQAYRDLESKVKELYRKLRLHVNKARPYFEQKKNFDWHLWQLKLRVDSIHVGLSDAKENYSVCLKSLEAISDEIHEKRKSKQMEAMLANLQEREAGVGADSSTEEETSLSASNLDLDFDSNVNFDNISCIMSCPLSEDLDISGDSERSVTGEEGDSKLQGNLPGSLENRFVYGLESPKEDSADGKENEQESAKSSLHLSNIEQLNQIEFKTNLEDEQSSIHNQISFNKESEESIRIQGTVITPGREEVRNASALEKESQLPEKTNEETWSDDFTVTIHVDEMHSSLSGMFKEEDSSTLDNEGLTSQVEENKQENILVNESQLLVNEDELARKKERYDSKQTETTGETGISKEEIKDAALSQNQTETENETGVEKQVIEKDGVINNGDNNSAIERITDQKDEVSDDLKQKS